MFLYCKVTFQRIRQLKWLSIKQFKGSHFKHCKLDWKRKMLSVIHKKVIVKYQWTKAYWSVIQIHSAKDIFKAHFTKCNIILKSWFLLLLLKFHYYYKNLNRIYFRSSGSLFSSKITNQLTRNFFILFALSEKWQPKHFNYCWGLG